MKDIRLLLSDVDGVMTDGGMYYSKDGDVMKRFCVYDGLGMKLLQQAGIRVGIITGETTEIVAARAQKLQLDYLFQGCKGSAKLDAAQKVCDELGITLDNVAYIGDDIIDYELLTHVGLAACPPNAMRTVREIPGILHLTTPGGEGAVRELADMILEHRL